MSQHRLNNFYRRHKRLIYFSLVVIAILTIVLTKYLSNRGFWDVTSTVLLDFAGDMILASFIFFFFLYFKVDEEFMSKMKELNSKKKQNETNGKLDKIFKIVKNLNVDDYNFNVYYNREEFYEEYFRLISNAKQEVYSSGDGFPFGNNRQSAIDGLKQAFLTALQNEVKIHRFQYKSTLTLAWAHRLHSLLDHNDFYLYINPGHDPNYETMQVPFCIIDPNEENESSTIIAFNSMEKSTGLKYNDFKIGLIFKGNIELATSFKKQLKSIYIDENRYVAPKDFKRYIDRIKQNLNLQLDEYFQGNISNIALDKKGLISIAQQINTTELDYIYSYTYEKLNFYERVLYFAYDLDIYRHNFLKKFPNAIYLGEAFSRRYKLSRNLISKSHNAFQNYALLNLTVNDVDYELPPEECLWGIVYAMTKEDFSRLELEKKAMGYKDGSNWSIRPIIHRLNKAESCNTFRTNIKVADASNNINGFHPEYKKTIIDGLHTHSFPKLHISKVCEIVTDEYISIT